MSHVVESPHEKRRSVSASRSSAAPTGAQETRLEAEARAVAGRLVREPALKSGADPSIELQAPKDLPTPGFAVNDETRRRIISLRGSGSPLESEIANQAGARFDCDFSTVRIHADSDSISLNRALGARAFTSGNDIFIGEKGSAHDRELMGHELTHVAQQRRVATMSATESALIQRDALDDDFKRGQEDASLGHQPNPGPVTEAQAVNYEEGYKKGKYEL